jgi:hypothetical protein
MRNNQDEDVKEYLARIRKTIADGDRIVSQAELRIAETDRMLEQQGLTREQVMAMRFTEAQIDAANEELKRRGLDPLDKWSQVEGLEVEGLDANADLPTSRPLDLQTSGPQDLSTMPDAELENRQRKFGMMMKPFQI